MRLTLKIGTATNNDKTVNIYSINSNLIIDEFEKQKKEFNNPQATDKDIMRIANLIIENKLVQKLGQLENLEEELGIDLITLFKALTQPIWVKGCCQSHFLNLIYNGDDFVLFKELTYSANDIEVLTKDYGKTWALTKEELL